MPIRGGGTYARYYGEIAAAPTGTPPLNSGYADTVLLKLYRWNGSAWIEVYDLVALGASYLLLETGDKLLLETGDKLLLE